MWHCVASLASPDVSTECGVFIFSQPRSLVRRFPITFQNRNNRHPTFGILLGTHNPLKWRQREPPKRLKKLIRQSSITSQKTPGSSTTPRKPKFLHTLGITCNQTSKLLILLPPCKDFLNLRSGRFWMESWMGNRRSQLAFLGPSKNMPTSGHGRLLAHSCQIII